MAMGLHSRCVQVNCYTCAPLTGYSEGLFTCLVGILFFFLISDFPEEVKWLTPEERQFVKARLQADVGESQRHKALKVKDVFKILREWKIILGGFMYFGLIVPAYGYGQYSPYSAQSRVLIIGPQPTSRLPSSSLWDTRPSGHSCSRYRHGHALLHWRCLLRSCPTASTTALCSRSCRKRWPSQASSSSLLSTTGRICSMVPCSWPLRARIRACL